MLSQFSLLLTESSSDSFVGLNCVDVVPPKTHLGGMLFYISSSHIV